MGSGVCACFLASAVGLGLKALACFSRAELGF